MKQEEKAVKPPKTESKYPTEVLKANSVKLFGITSSTFAGAFANAGINNTYSIVEAKKIIGEWLKKEAK